MTHISLQADLSIDLSCFYQEGRISLLAFMVSSAFSVYVIHYTGVFFGYLSVKTCKISVYVREDQSINQYQ